MKRHLVAFDCGNSSTRVVSGIFDGKRIKQKVIHQVPNHTVDVNGYYYWDILNIFSELKTGLKKAYGEFGKIDSVGIATWGIDFGLLGKSGQLLANPLCYRNNLGSEILDNLESEDKIRLFNATGIPEHPMNSVYQLMGIKKHLPELYNNADKLLLIPELLSWLFTGRIIGESTIASTTQTLDMRNNNYSEQVMSFFGIDPGLFAENFTEHGESYGVLRDKIAKELGINKCVFVNVPSHDTAAAVVSVPAEEEDFLFISSGTWSLIGTEMHKPVINNIVYEKGFANEGGALGTITLLKNSNGMFIFQQLKKEMETGSGSEYSWETLMSMAGDPDYDVPLFDPNAPEFFSPENMHEAVCTFVNKKLTDAEILKSSYFSLAETYKKVIFNIQEITDINYSSVYIVGGGSRNTYLNQLTANATGKKVTAGPVEATSLGNMGIQLKYFYPDWNLTDIRQIIKKSITVNVFLPED